MEQCSKCKEKQAFEMICKDLQKSLPAVIDETPLRWRMTLMCFATFCKDFI